VRQRSIVHPSAYFGASCLSLTQGRECNVAECPVACSLSPWGAWGMCNAGCGAGEQVRTRIILVVAQYGAPPCDAIEEPRTCTIAPCDVNCEVTDWAEWSECSTTCGTGSMTRSRVVAKQPSGNGVACPAVHEHASCNTHTCPVPCVVTAWTSFGVCTVTCGATGLRYRSRNVQQPQSAGGSGCALMIESTPCNTQPCPTDCVTSEWAAWTGCSESCGGGTMTHSRSVVVHPSFGGTSCPALSEQQTCNAQQCPVHCALGSWGAWALCDRACGSGTQLRARPVSIGATQPCVINATMPRTTLIAQLDSGERGLPAPHNVVAGPGKDTALWSLLPAVLAPLAHRSSRLAFAMFKIVRLIARSLRGRCGMCALPCVVVASALRTVS
jgi:hypothetical protein